MFLSSLSWQLTVLDLVFADETSMRASFSAPCRQVGMHRHVRQRTSPSPPLSTAQMSPLLHRRLDSVSIIRSREQLMGSHGPRFWRSGFVTSRERDAFYRDRLRPAAPPIAWNISPALPVEWPRSGEARQFAMPFQRRRVEGTIHQRGCTEAAGVVRKQTVCFGLFLDMKVITY